MIKDWRIYMLAVLLVSFAVSCEDDGDDTGLQNSDNNRMMAVMLSTIKSMDSLKMTNDPDNDFAMLMREHHKGAMNMGNLEIREGKDSELQEFARKMVAKQMKEIITLDSFLVVHAKADYNQNFSRLAKSAMEKMINNAKLQNITGNTDNDFARLMIQHHQGGIDMAELEINFGHSDGLKEEAKKTKEAQQKEIKELQDWLLKK